MLITGHFRGMLLRWWMLFRWMLLRLASHPFLTFCCYNPVSGIFSWGNQDCPKGTCLVPDLILLFTGGLGPAGTAQSRWLAKKINLIPKKQSPFLCIRRE